MSAEAKPSNSEKRKRERGAFIVFEGIDRSGKSTQCKELLSYLKKTETCYEFLRYPDRTSESGILINSYLQGTKSMNDRAIHLLFAANRHEDTPKIIDLLNNGINIICDRYSYSGAAYSAAKKKEETIGIKSTDKENNNENENENKNETKSEGMNYNNNNNNNNLIYWDSLMDLNWCLTCEQGLPKPDKIIYLNIDLKEAKKRGGFGNERYEKVDFLKRVQICYKQMQNLQQNDKIWKIINANRSKEEIHKEIIEVVEDTISEVSHKDIEYI